MKSDGEIMEVFEAYGLAKSFRAAAQVVGCSHHTVAKHVAARAAGRPLAEPVTRDKVTDEFRPKIEQLVNPTLGRIRTNIAHVKLVVIGYAWSEGSTRRAVAKVKAVLKLGRVRYTVPGSPNQMPGCNAIWVTNPALTGRKRCCSWRGWFGHASGL